MAKPCQECEYEYERGKAHARDDLEMAQRNARAQGNMIDRLKTELAMAKASIVRLERARNGAPL